MRILITGCDGFIATHLRAELRRAGHTVGGFDQARADIRDYRALQERMPRFRPEVVVHTAAVVGRERGEENRARTVATNALGTLNVARLAAARGARLVYVSSSEVYGDIGDDVAYEFTEPELPHNLYGLTKRWGEEAAELYAAEGLQIVRLSMPYGPGLPAGRGRAAIVNFLDQAHRRVGIPVHRGAERSWCWIGDTVRGIRMVVEKGQQGPRAGVYNVGRDDAALSMASVAELACELTGAPLRLITLVDPPAAQTVVKRLSTAKLAALGWAPEVELREGMQRTLAAMYPSVVRAA